MNRLTTLCLGGACAVLAALGPAGIAQADSSTLSGRYAAAGEDEFYVTATSNCTTPANGCTASLVSNRGWTSVATLTNGRWNFDVVKPDGVICGDGNYADVVIRYSFDASTMAGTVIADSNGECPGGQVTEGPLQLTKLS